VPSGLVVMLGQIKRRGGVGMCRRKMSFPSPLKRRRMVKMNEMSAEAVADGMSVLRMAGQYHGVKEKKIQKVK